MSSTTPDIPWRTGRDDKWRRAPRGARGRERARAPTAARGEPADPDASGQLDSDRDDDERDDDRIQEWRRRRRPRAVSPSPRNEREHREQEWEETGKEVRFGFTVDVVFPSEKTERPTIDMARRRDEALDVRGPHERLRQAALETELSLDGEIRNQERDVEGEHNDRRPGDIDGEPAGRSNLTEGEKVETEGRGAQREKQTALPAGVCLQGEQQAGAHEVARRASARVAMDKRETKRDPLHRRQVKLTESKKTRRRECEDDPAHERAEPAEPELAPQKKRPYAGKGARQQSHEVHRQQRIATRGENRCGQERASNLVLRIGERPRFGIKDIGVEYRERLVRERVHIPPESP